MNPRQIIPNRTTTQVESGISGLKTLSPCNMASRTDKDIARRMFFITKTYHRKE